MNFRGRQIDPVSFWSRYVTFPTGMKPDDVFAPKVPCPNPNHDTLKSHFQINLSQPTVHCFAYCGISGSYEHAICVIEGLYDKFDVEGASDERERKRRRHRAYREARKIILRNSLSGPKFHGTPHVQRKTRDSRSNAIVSSDELRYESFLPQIALEYLDGRLISEKSIAAWNIGWLPEDKRIAIPARDEANRLRFLIKRAVLPRQQPKYLYTEGFPKTSLLFGACQIDLGMVRSRGLILVEGSLDVIRFHQHGMANTTGILGTGISDAQVRIIEKLRPPKIILAFDKDSAGIRNIEIAAAKLRKYPLYVMKYPRGKSDPAELSRREALHQLDTAIPFPVFARSVSLNILQRRKEVGSLY